MLETSTTIYEDDRVLVEVTNKPSHGGAYHEYVIYGKSEHGYFIDLIFVSSIQHNARYFENYSRTHIY